jgi:hypothetical protein
LVLILFSSVTVVSHEGRLDHSIATDGCAVVCHERNHEVGDVIKNLLHYLDGHMVIHFSDQLMSMLLLEQLLVFYVVGSWGIDLVVSHGHGSASKPWH